MVDVSQQLGEMREVRRRVEEQILPIATSLDGRRFSLQLSLHRLFARVGGYVLLETTGGPALGQIVKLEVAERVQADGMAIRAALGEGVILSGSPGAFHDAVVREAAANEVSSSLGLEGGGLQVGSLALQDGVAATLDPRGFGRHSFLCGQSGSGKTYSLGVLLERLLVETSLRMIVLDPNSDYVGLGDPLPSAPPEYVAAASTVEVRSGESLRLRLGELSTSTQAALLRLDPIADRDEYAAFAAVSADARPESLDELRTSDDPAELALSKRVANLGIESWPLWARGEASMLQELGSARCTVVDLGSLGGPDEQELVAAAVLEQLWAQREEREPVLIVVDEAHNVCPADPPSAISRIATDYAIKIAAEGRKFGLYFLLSTQRPQKLHEQVVSQCDNLLMLRLNSVADAARLGATFSFVPPGLLELAPGFRRGEALVAGPLTQHPLLVQIGERVSREGGGDVASTWAG